MKWREVEWREPESEGIMFAYFLFLYLGLHNFEFSRWGLLIGHKIFCINEPAKQRFKGILESPTMKEGFLQLSSTLNNLNDRLLFIFLSF